MESIYRNAIEASTSNSVLRGRLKNWAKNKSVWGVNIFFRGLRCGPAGRVMTLMMWDLLKNGWLCFFFFSLPNWWIRQAGAEAAEKKSGLPRSERARLCRCVFASVCIISLVCLFMIVSIKNCTACRNWLARGPVWWWHNKGFPQSILPSIVQSFAQGHASLGTIWINKWSK